MQEEEEEEEWAQGLLGQFFGRTCFCKGKEVVCTEKTRRPPEDD